MEDQVGPEEEEAPAAAIQIPTVEVLAPEVTVDSSGGENEISIQAVQRKEQLVIRGDQSIPIPEWLNQRIQKSQQKEVDPTVELQKKLD